MKNDEILILINELSDALITSAEAKAKSKEFYQAEIQRCLDALDGQNPDLYFSSLITMSLPKDHIYENFYLINGHKKRICDLDEGPIYGKVDYEDVDKNNVGYWFNYIQKEDKNIVLLKDPPIKTECDQNGVKAKTRYGIHRVHIAAVVDSYICKMKALIDSNAILNDAFKIPKKAKIPAHNYALYHWIRIKLNLVKPFEKNEDDLFPKKEIMKYAKDEYKLKSGDVFYTAFRKIDILKTIDYPQVYGKNYKENIKEISERDYRVINYLKKLPN